MDLGERVQGRIEAALYAAGRPLSTSELVRAAGITSTKKVLQMMRDLKQKVNSSFDAIEMLELEGERFVIQLKPEYTSQARKFSSRLLLSKAQLKTLSYVVYFQPISGKELAERRGPNAYQHLRSLHQLGFIRGEPHGRTKLFRTTSSFADYFGVSSDPNILKDQISKVGLKVPLTEIGAT